MAGRMSYNNNNNNNNNNYRLEKTATHDGENSNIVLHGFQSSIYICCTVTNDVQ
jgi:hypothetical protein